MNLIELKSYVMNLIFHLPACNIHIFHLASCSIFFIAIMCSASVIFMFSFVTKILAKFLLSHLFEKTCLLYIWEKERVHFEDIKNFLRL